MFILGLITGLLIAFFIFTIELILDAKREKTLTKIIKDKVDKKFKRQPKFFEPRTERQETQQEIIAENEKHGRGTKAEDLGL